MILVKNNNKFGHIEPFLPMPYENDISIRHGGPLYAGNQTPRTVTNLLTNSLWHFSPVPTGNVPTLIASTPTTSPWRNGWARIKRFDGCIVKPAVRASVNDRVRSWNTPNCPKRTWCPQGRFVLNKTLFLSSLLVLPTYAVMDVMLTWVMRQPFDVSALLTAVGGIVLGIACAAAFAQQNVAEKSS
jgi:hypothetical protein